MDEFGGERSPLVPPTGKARFMGTLPGTNGPVAIRPRPNGIMTATTVEDS